ncbi:MAG: SxtJ family membrane protein [Pirellulaceae bacterium]
MALVEINWRPSAKELRVFAILLVLFSGIVTWVIGARLDAPLAGTIVFGVAAGMAALGLLVPRLIWPVYVVWMAAALPVGWLVSHAVMAAVFYLVITPIGFIMRVCGRDPMERRFDKDASSYWKERDEPTETRRYFRQF